MSDDGFGKRGDAQKILEQAKVRIAGQEMSEDNLKKAQEMMNDQAAKDHTLEAAGFTEELIAWCNEQWNDREFSVEQRVFSLSLAFINFSSHFPEDKGGGEAFARIYKEARKYFDDNNR